MAVKRLDRLLSELGVATRSELRQMIKSGRVTVDGAAAVRPDMKMEQGHGICVDGAELCTNRLRYFMMDKPEGVLSATEDKRQETVLDILPPDIRRIGLFPVGRLDKDTSGLLLLTNDGDFAHRVISPKSGIEKLYYAEGGRNSGRGRRKGVRGRDSPR
ncbi:MAG: pseudouridine synthase [Oscillospiraceae bacterium]